MWENKWIGINIKILLIFVVTVATTVGIVCADEFTRFSPPRLVLNLEKDEVVTEQVSMTVFPFCIRAFDADVVASDPTALVTNLTGVQSNGCGGDTSTFDIEITGTGESQNFDLNFIDVLSGSVLGSIPVVINKQEAVEEQLMGLLVLPKGILFQVPSSGCTKKSDFEVEVLETTPIQIRLNRLQEDFCDAYQPLGTFIRFSYTEIGLEQGEQFQVINPIIAAEVPPWFLR